MIVGLGKSANTHIVRLMNSRRKRSKKNDDKSAVAMLKKKDWHENVREPVVNHAKGQDRSGRPDKKRDHELKRGPAGRRSSKARQLGCVFQDMKPQNSILRKSSDMQKPIQRLHVTLKFETKILRWDIFAQVNLMSAAPTLQNLRIGLRRSQSSVEAGQKCV